MFIVYEKVFCDMEGRKVGDKGAVTKPYLVPVFTR